MVAEKPIRFQQPDARGYYGEFGGRYVPEMLHPNVVELEAAFNQAWADADFQQQWRSLLKDYVGRPTPLYKAKKLGAELGLDLWLKREDLCHTGAHKINNTVGQALLALRLGKQHIVAETGAGQHGVATATVCALLGLECTVFMGAKDMERQAPNVARMKMLGATVKPAISGSQTLKDATNEALRYWINHRDDTHYIIGSVVGPHPFPHLVASFQSIISEEIVTQLRKATGASVPAAVVACVGGGSNAAGAFFHFMENEAVELWAVEAAGEGVASGKSAATTALGTPGILHGSKSLVMQTADGQVVEPHSISAGLDYPGIGPLHASLFASGRGRFVSITDAQALDAASQLSRLEGIIPALETAHALAALPQLAGTQGPVVLCLSGRGDKDMATYQKHFAQ